MILTTSRKPSKKTRRFSKVLAKFMNWRYLNRGKMSMEDLLCFNELAIIEEFKGNPAVLKIYKSNKEVLRLRFNVSNINKFKMDDSPVFFVGKLQFDPFLLGAVPQTKAGDKLFKKMDVKKKVFVKRKNSDTVLIFEYNNFELFKMKILDIKFWEKGL